MAARGIVYMKGMGLSHRGGCTLYCGGDSILVFSKGLDEGFSSGW